MFIYRNMAGIQVFCGLISKVLAVSTRVIFKQLPGLHQCLYYKTDIGGTFSILMVSLNSHTADSKKKTNSDCLVLKLVAIFSKSTLLFKVSSGDYAFCCILNHIFCATQLVPEVLNRFIWNEVAANIDFPDEASSSNMICHMSFPHIQITAIL